MCAYICVRACVCYKLPVSLNLNVSVTSECSLVRQRESKQERKLERDRGEGRHERNDKKDKTDFSTQRTAVGKVKLLSNTPTRPVQTWKDGLDRLSYFESEKVYRQFKGNEDTIKRKSSYFLSLQ